MLSPPPSNGSASIHSWVYSFGGGHADGNRHMKDLLGGKGANLAEMAALGLPVPPGFTISTLGCKYVCEHGGALPETLVPQVDGTSPARARRGRAARRRMAQSGAAGGPRVASPVAIDRHAVRASCATS